MAQTRGAFPYPYAQVAEGTTRIALPSGAAWYCPAGEYIIATDAQSVIQYWQPQAQAWVTFIPVSNGDWVSSDGYNIRVVNTTGAVTGTTLTAVGSGMTNGIGSAATGVSLAYGASTTTGYPTATAQVVIGGSVAAPTITQAGTGFLVPPILYIDPPPPGGIQAAAHAVLTAVGGGIASVVMDVAGAGYPASPNFYIAPQFASYAGGPTASAPAGANPAPGTVNQLNAVPGYQNAVSTGALLTPAALTGSGTIIAVTITNGGGGYTAAPTLTATGGSGTITLTPLVAVTTLAVAVITVQPRVQ